MVHGHPQQRIVVVGQPVGQPQSIARTVSKFWQDRRRIGLDGFTGLIELTSSEHKCLPRPIGVIHFDLSLQQLDRE